MIVHHSKLDFIDIDRSMIGILSHWSFLVEPWVALERLIAKRRDCVPIGIGDTEADSQKKKDGKIST